MQFFHQNLEFNSYIAYYNLDYEFSPKYIHTTELNKVHLVKLDYKVEKKLSEKGFVTFQNFESKKILIYSM